MLVCKIQEVYKRKFRDKKFQKVSPQKKLHTFLFLFIKVTTAFSVWGGNGSNKVKRGLFK